MAFSSLVALQESQKLSSGICWWVLFTFTHSLMPAPLRLVSPSTESIVSRGNTYLPSRFDVQFGSERFDEIPRAMISMDGVSGVILDALLQLPSSPTISIEVVLETSLDTVQTAMYDLEISPAVRVEGVASISAELVANRFNALPFPGFNMDRRRVPGIFTDIA